MSFHIIEKQVWNKRMSWNIWVCEIFKNPQCVAPVD